MKRPATGIADSGAEKLEGKEISCSSPRGATVRFQAAWLGPEDFDRVCLVLRDGIRGPRCWSGNPPQPANVAPPQLPVQVDRRPPPADGCNHSAAGS